jgi:hypothetical protein
LVSDVASWPYARSALAPSSVTTETSVEILYIAKLGVGSDDQQVAAQ